MEEEEEEDILLRQMTAIFKTFCDKHAVNEPETVAILAQMIRDARDLHRILKRYTNDIYLVKAYENLYTRFRRVASVD
jgi:hypothetical protein